MFYDRSHSYLRLVIAEVIITTFHIIPIKMIFSALEKRPREILRDLLILFKFIAALILLFRGTVPIQVQKVAL